VFSSKILKIVLIVVSQSLSLISFAQEIFRSKPRFAIDYLSQDSVLLKIYETYDINGQLDGYTSHILTPVCKNYECYNAELDYYWDVLGNFFDFIIISGKPLTKLDHIPFQDSDYEKLKNILLTKSPSFIHLRRDELVVKPIATNLQDVNGISGATIKYIEKDMVSGAIYTCYTLWHIANGDINFQLQEYTKQNLNKELIFKLLNLDNVEAHYFAIENMDSNSFEFFIDEIVELCKKYGQYFTNRLYDQLPDDLSQRLKIILKTKE